GCVAGDLITPSNFAAAQRDASSISADLGVTARDGSVIDSTTTAKNRRIRIVMVKAVYAPLVRREARRMIPRVQIEIPYLPRVLPGVGGVIKQRPEDFFVQEIPLYEASGEGEHVYAEIQKVGVTTFDAIRRIAGALGLSTREIGYAGMKDAQAVSRQI